MFDSVVDKVGGILRTLFASLCSFIYMLISKIYYIFYKIATMDILQNDAIKDVYQRITVILSMIMVFYITFEFVNYVINPDKMTDKEKGAGKIAYRACATVVMIAFVPTIFSTLYSIQGKILQSGVIGRIVLGTKISSSESNESGNNTFSESGNELATELFFTFYSVPEKYKNEKCYKSTTCNEIYELNKSTLRVAGELPYIGLGLDKKIKGNSSNISVDEYAISFNWFLCLIAGGFVCYILVLYTIDIARRWLQIIYLQLIAPIPIISYIVPTKDGMFQKWVRQCVTTFLDVFIRLFTIYYVILIIRILDSQSFISTFNNENGWIVKVFIIMGLLLLAKKIPDLISDLLPKGGVASGEFGLSASKRVAPAAARAIGAAIGSTAFVKSAISRGINTYRRNKTNAPLRATKDERNKHRQDAKDKREAARQARKDLNKAYRVANATGASDSDKEQLESARKNYTHAMTEKYKAENQVAKDDNQRKRSVTAGVITGAAGGAVRGATTGFGATKLEDVSKKVKEGYQRQIKAESANEKYLDEGGRGGFIPTDKYTSKIEKSFGLSTPAAETKDFIDKTEEGIKKVEASINQGNDVTKSADASKDRGTSKISDGSLKNTIGNELNGFVTNSGTNISSQIQPGEKLSAIDARMQLDKKNASDTLQSLIDAQAKAEAEGKPQSFIDAIKQKIEDAKKTYLKADNDATEVRKKLVEVARDQILRSIATGGSLDNYDPVMVNNEMKMLSNLRMYRQNDMIKAIMFKLAQNAGPGSDEELAFNAIFDGNDVSVDSFDTYNKIEKIIKQINNNAEIENSERKANLEEVKTGNQYKSEQAADNAVGDGKK